MTLSRLVVFPPIVNKLMIDCYTVAKNNNMKPRVSNIEG